MSLWSSMDTQVGHYRRYVKKDVKRLFNNDWNVKKYTMLILWDILLLCCIK